MTQSRTKILFHLIRIVLGFIFIYASLDKMLHPATFAQVIYHYKVLPVELINLAAIVMPWLEFILGIFLIFGIWLKTAAILGGIIMISFIALMGSAMIRGLNIECGCFALNPQAALVGWRRISEDLLMLAGFIYLALLPKQKSIMKN